MLTFQQEAILKVAKEKGFVTIKDTHKIYSSNHARRNALMLLVNLGYLRQSLSVPNRFDLVEGAR